MPCATAMEESDKTARLSKAAYLMVKGSIGEDLVKKEELIEALQFAGDP